MFLHRLLLEIETEFRNTYWHIRNSRKTNWQAINRTRVLAELLYRLDVPRYAVKEARYCLRTLQCKRCAADVDGLSCHSFSSRKKRGDYK